MKPVRETEIPEDRREAMNQIGRMLDDIMPDGLGFALLIFDYGGAGEMSFISNAKREDMLIALKEFIAANEGRLYESDRIQ